jgi:hypothetical protein
MLVQNAKLGACHPFTKNARLPALHNMMPNWGAHTSPVRNMHVLHHLRSVGEYNIRTVRMYESFHDLSNQMGRDTTC